MTAKELIHTFIPLKLKQQIKCMAAHQGISITDIVNKQLRRYVKQHIDDISKNMADLDIFEINAFDDYGEYDSDEIDDVIAKLG
jgi:hypothetical protein